MGVLQGRGNGVPGRFGRVSRAEVYGPDDRAFVSRRDAAVNRLPILELDEGNAMTDHAPYLVAAANKLKLDINSITGTGTGGRVTINDVRAAAASRGAQVPAGATQVRNVAAGRRPTPIMRPLGDPAGNFLGPPFGEVDIFSVNPILDYYNAIGAPRVVGAFPTPTFFLSGVTPPLTACGADPSLLLQIPWAFRHSAALTTDASFFLQLVELGDNFTSYDDSDKNTQAGRDAFTDYKLRMRTWFMERPTDPDEEHAYLFPPKPEGKPIGNNVGAFGRLEPSDIQKGAMETVETATQQVHQQQGGK